MSQVDEGAKAAVQKRKTSAPVKDRNGGRVQKPRQKVSELREQIKGLQARLDFANGVQTADTNGLEWNQMHERALSRYRVFVGGACAGLKLPRSFLLDGIESGRLTSWQQARGCYKKQIQKACQGASGDAARSP